MIYIAIDLKSFYASVECVDRLLDTISKFLVVADKTRTSKTICLAVSPALKNFGIGGRPRLFEVEQKINQLNRFRKVQESTESSTNFEELQTHPQKKIDFLVAPPRMAHYIEISRRIYEIYLKYVAPEDIHVYSIDEVFIDATSYLKTYGLTAHDFAQKLIFDVFNTTGITATAGIGPNLYLAKIAMDIEAKHIEADQNGVRIAELTVESYRKKLWMHRPLTDFWRVGKGYAKRLEQVGLYTMGDIARCSLGSSNEYYNEELLFKLFGVNAELLIDHAWGWEPCTIADIKAYKTENSTLGSGQVLQEPYSFDKALLIAKEMVDLLALDLVDKNLVTSQLVLTVGYDIENISNSQRVQHYRGEIVTDSHGRKMPKPAHGSINLPFATSSSKQLMLSITKLFQRIVQPELLIRRLNISANHIVSATIKNRTQLDLFDLNEESLNISIEKNLEHEKKVQSVMLSIQKRFGKNAILRGMNLEEGATTQKRNKQIGGHRA